MSNQNEPLSRVLELSIEPWALECVWIARDAFWRNRIQSKKWTKLERFLRITTHLTQQNRVRTRFKDRSLAYCECLSISLRSQARTNQVGGNSKLQNPFWTNRVLLSPKDTFYDWTAQDSVWSNAGQFQKFLTRVVLLDFHWFPCILSEDNCKKQLRRTWLMEANSFSWFQSLGSSKTHPKPSTKLRLISVCKRNVNESLPNRSETPRNRDSPQVISTNALSVLKRQRRPYFQSVAWSVIRNFREIRTVFQQQGFRMTNKICVSLFFFLRAVRKKLNEIYRGIMLIVNHIWGIFSKVNFEWSKVAESKHNSCFPVVFYKGNLQSFFRVFKTGFGSWNRSQ